MDQAGKIRIRKFLSKNITIILLLAVGILLMLLPPTEKHVEKNMDTSSNLSIEQTFSLQDQLSALLTQVEGAGKVDILLSVAVGEKKIYQTDDTVSGSQTVIITDSNRNQGGVVCMVEPPTYLGAVIVCQGADRPSVRLALSQAVSNATGLGFDKITILKMK